MSSKFHERMASSAASQMNSVVSWAERRTIQAAKVVAYGIGSVALFNFLVIFTIILYLFLYWMVIPNPMTFETDLNFDFDVDRDGPPVLEGPRKVPFEFPVAKVLFASYDQQYQIEWKEPNKNVSEPKWIYPGKHENPIVYGEVYDVTLSLTLPDNHVNNEVGNFMVETLLFIGDRSGEAKPIVASRRPLSMPYRTWFSTSFSDLFFLPFRFLLGWFQPEQILSVKVIEGWIEETDYRRVPNGAKVTLSDPRLLVKRSSVRFDVRLSGLRYYMYYWFWTSFLFLISFAVTFSSGFTFTALAARVIGPVVQKRVRFNLPNLFGESSEEEEEEDEIEQGPEQEEEEVEEEQESEGVFEDEPVDTTPQETRSEPVETLFPSMVRGSTSKTQTTSQPEPSESSSAGFVTPAESEDELSSAEEDDQKTQLAVQVSVFANETAVVEPSQPAPNQASPAQSSASSEEERSSRLSSDPDVVMVDPSGIPPHHE